MWRVILGRAPGSAGEVYGVGKEGRPDLGQWAETGQGRGNRAATRDNRLRIPATRAAESMGFQATPNQTPTLRSRLRLPLRNRLRVCIS